jgi:hypothetical protein
MIRIHTYGSGINPIESSIKPGTILDVVGCAKRDLGRSCDIHDSCGMEVVVNEIMDTHRVVVDVNNGN